VAERLSLIGGSGALVPEVIASARRRGFAVQLLTIPERRAPAGVAVQRFGFDDPLAGLAAIRAFGATLVTMAGGVTLSDRGRETLLAAMGDGGTAAGDTMVSGLAGAIERHTGARVVGVHQLMPELVAQKGHIAGRRPTSELTAIGANAVKIARQAGALDAGQAVVVAGRRVVAIEDVAGTDALLSRVRSHVRRGLAGDGRSPLVLAKAAKPDQPLTVDLPAIGPRTIAGAARAGIALVAVEAGATLVLERQKVEAAAEKAGIAVVGFIPGDD
jgi:DUF1009 family protein